MFWSEKDTRSDIYAGASEYLLYQNENFFDALQLAELAIEHDPDNGWARNLRVKLYERLKQWDKALEEIDRTIQHVQAKAFSEEAERKRRLKQLHADRKRIRELKG